MYGNIFGGKKSGFGTGISNNKLSKIMLDIIDQIPKGTTNLKEVVVSSLGMIGSMSTSRDINSAWTLAKKQAAKLYCDKFVLDKKGSLCWYDETKRDLDTKISTRNFERLNDLSEREGLSVDKLITKLIASYTGIGKNVGKNSVLPAKIKNKKTISPSL